MRVIVAEGADLPSLRERHARRLAHGEADESFARFLRDQALLVLERAERQARGARYKVPRLLPGDVFGNAAFRVRLASIAADAGKPVEAIEARAERYLREMAASQTPFTLDLITALYRAGVRGSHDPRIDVPDGALDRLRALLQRHPVVFCISHKSMLDTVAFALVMFDADLPIPLTFGGINLNTPGVGALAKRAGIIFLRRAFQDNETYKAVFRRYIDYLIDKRFALLWALEGTRSRTGKLLEPRFGLFNYVVDSLERTGVEDLRFVPVSVTYDQITEVDDYASEQRGRSKRGEGAGWMLRFFRRGNSHGRIFVRFGTPLTLGDVAPKVAAAGAGDDARGPLVRALALEVAQRLNAATPVTATAIVTLALLSAGRRAQKLHELHWLVRVVAILVRRRRIECVGTAGLRKPETLRALLAQLHATGIVSYFDEGIERLYGIRPEQHLKAAYYRNTAIHHFVADAIAELSMLAAADAAASGVADVQAAFLGYANALRELLRFEFFFAGGADFEAEVSARAQDRFDGWQRAAADGPRALEDLLARARPLVAHGVLRAFADAYRVVATVLAQRGEAAITDKSALQTVLLRFGRQELALDNVFSPESVSRVLHEGGLKLAAHRGLLEADRADGRRALEAEWRAVVERLERILSLGRRSQAH